MYTGPTIPRNSAEEPCSACGDTNHTLPIITVVFMFGLVFAAVEYYAYTWAALLFIYNAQTRLQLRTVSMYNVIAYSLRVRIL